MDRSRSPAEVVAGGFSFFFGMSGRASRSHYWLGMAALLFGAPVAMFALMLTFGLSSMTAMAAFKSAMASFAKMAVVSSALLYIAGIALLVLALLASMTALSVRRLHDRDKGWPWCVLFVLGPGALDGLATASGGGSVLAGGANAASLGLALWGLVELGFLPGTTGPNRYGPDPVGEPQTPPAAA